MARSSEIENWNLRKRIIMGTKIRVDRINFLSCLFVKI